MSSFITSFSKRQKIIYLLSAYQRNTISTANMQSASKNHDYEACICALNNLQTNAQYLKSKAMANGGNHNGGQLNEVIKYLNRAGLSMNNLDELSVIHVAGTKGKGTTCAFSERILRDHGYKTGFFSSPHLLEVRERIRINGKPVPREDFIRHFWKIYNSLDQTKTHDHDMPIYFRFLTIMAFSIFLEKKVDVAIMEVGIGGEYDCTNILRKVPVVGITSLGIDHVSLLGNTIESIAWNKAGIMKEGCKAFTVPQPEAAMKVLRERSVEKKCSLEVVNSLHFKFPPKTSSCPPEILNLNASLAVALCQEWLSIKHNNNLGHPMSKEITENALFNCTWPGRFQIKHEKNITYYLDGAHTLESITICSNWFKDMTKCSKKKKALMFNVTGDRNAENLLEQLHTCNFNTVLFVTNNTDTNKADNTNFQSIDVLLEKCRQHKHLWLKLEQGNEFKKTEICEAFPTVGEAVKFITNQEKYDLLVTGSLHLIGSLFSILDPHFNGNI